MVKMMKELLPVAHDGEPQEANRVERNTRVGQPLPNQPFVLRTAAPVKRSTPLARQSAGQGDPIVRNETVAGILCKDSAKILVVPGPSAYNQTFTEPPSCSARPPE